LFATSGFCDRATPAEKRGAAPGGRRTGHSPGLRAEGCPGRGRWAAAALGGLPDPDRLGAACAFALGAVFLF